MVRFFPSLPHSTPAATLSRFHRVQGDGSPHGGCHSRCHRSASTHHQQALTSPAVPATVGQLCQEMISLVRPTDRAVKTQRSFLAFSICREVGAWKLGYFSSYISFSKKKKRYNFFLQSVPVVSVDHIYNTIRNLANAIQRGLQICACWNAVQEPEACTLDHFWSVRYMCSTLPLQGAEFIYTAQKVIEDWNWSLESLNVLLGFLFAWEKHLYYLYVIINDRIATKTSDSVQAK